MERQREGRKNPGLITNSLQTTELIQLWTDTQAESRPLLAPTPQIEPPPPPGSLVWQRPDDWLSSDVYGKWHHYKYIKGSGMVVALCLNRPHLLNIILIASPSLQKRQINHG